MLKIVIEIEHIVDEKQEEGQFDFKVTVNLVGAEDSCPHEMIVAELMAGAMDGAQESIMIAAVKELRRRKDLKGEGKGKDDKKYRGNGHMKGEILH